MKVEQAINLLKPYATKVYGNNYKDIIESVDTYTDILQSRTGSIKRVAKKMGLTENDSKALAICAYKIDSSRENIYRYIIIPKIKKEEELCYFLAHELFGHGIGNLKNIIKFTDEGLLSRYYSGFSYKDFLQRTLMHATIEEGFALYIDRKILKLMGINALKYRRYNTRGEIIAEELVKFLLEEMPEVRKELLDSYIYKTCDITDILNIDEVSKMLDILDNPWYENKSLENKVYSQMNSKTLLKK